MGQPRSTLPPAATASGEYVVSNLPLGFYEVSAQMTGFKKTIHPAVEMTVKARLRVDLQLEVGELGQPVEIAGATPVLKTDTAEVSTLISRKSQTGRNKLSSSLDI